MTTIQRRLAYLIVALALVITGIQIQIAHAHNVEEAENQASAHIERGN